MIKNLIKTSILITQSTYDKLLKTKYDYVLNVKNENKNYNENQLEEIALQFLTEVENNIYPPSICFHEGDINDFSIISSDYLTKEEYEKLLEMKQNIIKMENLVYQMIGCNNKMQKIPTEIKNIKNFTRQELLEEIKLILSLNNPISKNKENLNPELNKMKSLEEILGNYIITPFNFIKMIIILLRIRENIPIILMCEPGCGKKSLIKKLSALLNDGKENIEMITLNESLTNEDIENFLFKTCIVDRTRELERREKEEKKIYETKGQKYMKQKKLWIYFHNINTCNCMGLITEIMTKHTCNGKKLPESFYFIGSCYPYKLNEEEDNYALKLNNSKFLYSVKSLPFSLLNLVFNFGNIKNEEEEIYIKSLVESFMKRFFWKQIEKRNADKRIFDKDNLDKYLTNEENELFNNLISLSSNSIIEAHNYLREINNNYSSTSLEKIKYFKKFYEFFFEYFNNKKENKNLKDICANKKIYINSIKLSIHLCYYLSLSNMKYRKEFSLRMNKVFGDNFLDAPEQEQKYIANNITIEPGIAKNRMLLENLFALFACINTKIPLFIIGKPGSSKSLSVELICKEMKGIYSENSLFQSYQKLFHHTFQCSNQQKFHNTVILARKVLENKDNCNENISMIYLKEIGLSKDSIFSELSYFNSNFEYYYSQKNRKLAFVGASNYIFDYNKVDKEGILLLIPPYDKEELENTSLNIAESYNEKLANDNKDLFIALADSYFEYKEILKNQYPEKKDFHGNNDFYYLIKTAMRQLLQEKNKNNPDSQIDENKKKEIGINSIERNFGGLNINILNEIKPAMEIMKQNFMKKFSNFDFNYKYDIKRIIYENIMDKNSRHLLLITKSSIPKSLLNNILTSNELWKDLKKEISFYLGSKFIKDINSKEYCSKILNKIQNEMEQNKILLLNELNELYPLLEDLFGKKYLKIGGKNFARISYGNNNYTYSFVNEEFKCVILMDEQNLDKMNVNFLNKFEKHIISYDDILSKEFLDEAERINNMLKDLLNMNLLKNNLDYDNNKILININIDEIKGIIYNNLLEYQTQGKTLLIQDILDIVLNKISLKLPKDIILSMKNSTFEQKYPNVANTIMKYYQKDENKKLNKFLEKKNSGQNIIYTYTGIDEALSFNEEINNDFVGKINKNNIKEIKINSLNDEKELELVLESIYSGEENKIKVILFKFNYSEISCLDYVKSFIENYIKENNYLNEKNNKIFIFTIHMNKILQEDEFEPKIQGFNGNNESFSPISYLNDAYQVFIDYLN